jgi:flagellar basal body-associated protein FliL
MKIAKKKSNPKIKILFFICALLAMVAGAALIFFYTNQNKNGTHPTVEIEAVPPPTKEVTVKEETLVVPTETPPNAIKDYSLLVENENFKIRHNEGSQYVVSLYPIVNNSQQYDEYQEQLRQYKQLALDYLKQQGLDPIKLDIIYEPAEAKDL